MKILENLDLTNYNSYRIHSVARRAYFPESEEEILEVSKLKDVIIIGGGCNIIFSKPLYDEPLVFIRDNYSCIRQDGNILNVLAGTDLKVLSEYALERSLTGLEYYFDIPGCVGGATIMNAGCQRISFSDMLLDIKILDLKTKTIRVIQKDDAHFEYRGNIFSETPVVVLEVRLQLQDGDQVAIRSLMESSKKSRWAKQPREYPSAGSVFKRPIGHYVGPMITEAGLKGYRIGDAEVSTKHGGFIINKGNATGTDIIQLINYIQSVIKNKFGVELKTEQRII